MMNQSIDPATARFIETAQAVPPLSREEENTLAARARAGDRRAADRLLEAHLRDVVFVAKKHRYYGIPLGDLIAEGNLGLLRALEKFEPERGVRFSTYAAHWIRSFIMGYVLRSWTLVGGRTGVLSSNLFFRLRRERARLESLYGSGNVARSAPFRRGFPSSRSIGSGCTRKTRCSVSTRRYRRRPS